MNRIALRAGSVAVAAACLTGLMRLPASAAAPTAAFAVQFSGLEAPVRLSVPAAAAAETLAALQADPRVRIAEPMASYRVSALAANDAHFDEQWYLRKVTAPDAWDRSVGSADVVVAILDTGVDVSHPDLRDNIWQNPREIEDGRDNDGNGLVDDLHGWNFYDGNAEVAPVFESFTATGINHGTLIAGEIGAIGGNGQGIAGVNWRVSLMPIRVLSSSGIGDIVHVVDGINYAIRNGADVISLSFSGLNRSAILDDAIRRANEAGILVVAAAGNDGNGNGGTDLDRTPLYPACSDGPNGENWVLGVAATDEEDRKAQFSDFGRRCVDISAPGVRIFSTLVARADQPGFGQAYGGYYSGTSLAAPLVAGAAALLKSYSPGLTLPALRDLLLASADGIDPANPAYAGKLGRGRLNIARALTLAPTSIAPQPPGAPVAPPAPATGQGLQAVVTASGPGTASSVAFRGIDGVTLASFAPYAAGFRGGVLAQAGDVDGDGNFEIVTVPGPSGGPHVRVFTLGGTLKSEFFAYESAFRGGLSLAVEDVDGDGISDIVVSPLAGRAPEVRVFDAGGARKASFLAYASGFRGGVRVAAGDVDGDGDAEIVTVPASGGGPHVRLWQGDGGVFSGYFAEDPGLRSGYLVAMGDVNGDGRADIGVLDAVNGSRIRFRSAYGVLVGEIEIEGIGKGFTYALADVNGDGRADLMLGVQPTGRLILRSYDVVGKLLREATIGAGTATSEVRVAPVTGFVL